MCDFSRLEIVSPRLVIRTIEDTPEDRDFYVSLYTNPSVMEFIGNPLSKEKAQNSYKAALKLSYTPVPQRLFCIVTSKDSQQSVGLVGLTWAVGDRQCQTAEVSVVLSPPFFGQGFASEALRAAGKYLFDNKIATMAYGFGMARNQASKKMVQNAGFEIASENDALFYFRASEL